MWIDKRIIPALIDAVEITLQQEMAAMDQDNYDPDIHYDPNDLIIFDGFVLPVLKDNLNYGFYASEMLYKGFGFLMGLIDGYLQVYGHTLTADVRGGLMRLHYQYHLKEALQYLNCMDNAVLCENIDNVNQHIQCALVSAKKPTKPLLVGNIVPLKR